MTVIEQVRALGYDVAIAYGCVATEEAALAEARNEANPDTIASNAESVTRSTLSDLQLSGRLPDSPHERRSMAESIALSAIDGLTERATERVAFHERALEIARGMPTTYLISGPGFSMYFSVDDATGDGFDEEQRAALASLTDPDLHRERYYWYKRLDDHPNRGELIESVNNLRRKGWTVKPEIKDDGAPEVRISAEGQTETIADTLDKLCAAAATFACLSAES